jgi:outer membrane immunogenic protein
MVESIMRAHKFLAGVSTLALSLHLANAAVAADPPQAPVPPVFIPEAGQSWTGPYIGAFVGAGGIVDNIELPGLGPGNFNGVGGEGLFGGLMLGYNFQVSNNFVIGIEGEIGITDLTTDLSIPVAPISLDAQPEWTAAVSGRLGWLTSPKTMLYLIGGYSYADYNVDIAAFGGAASFSQDYHGFHVGTGIETHISNSLTARVEYRYTQYGGEDWGTAGFLDVEPSSHTGRIALAYNFYDFGPDGATSTAPAYAPDSWTGFYAGLYGGAGAIVNDIALSVGGGAGTFNGIGGEGLLGGGMIGYDHQFGANWVAGIQGEIGITDLTTELNIPGAISLDAQPEWTAAVSGRLGWLPMPETMLYVIGGYSYADYNVDIAAFGGAASFSQDYHGFHVGTGIETYLAKNVTARVEYRYTQYGGEDWGVSGPGPAGANFPISLDVEPSSHTGLLGIVWKFGG